jgi:hypothetical protein
MIPMVAASGKCFFCKKYPEDRKKLKNGVGATGRGCIMSVTRRGSRAKLYGNFGWWPCMETLQFFLTTNTFTIFEDQS